MKFPFIDLQAQRKTIRDEIDAAVNRVIRHGAYILGPEVAQFEGELAAFENVGHVAACANGTDALKLPMLAWGIGGRENGKRNGERDAVFCPSFTYTATAEAIAVIGATPVFVDIDPDTYTMCPQSLQAAIDGMRRAGKLIPRAVVAVDLFGQSADYPAIAAITEAEDLKLISDNAQSLGCRLNGHSSARWADVATTSFFPAKPLGCYGDGGAMLTNDGALTARLRDLAFHGRSSTPFDHDSIGLNSRLDTIQAAILLEKLKIFAREIDDRNAVAARYERALNPLGVKTPTVIENGISTWAQYTVEIDNRDTFLDNMRAQEIPVAAYYPRPVHLQSAYTEFPISGNGLPVTEKAMHTVAALPMHAYLTRENQDMVIEAVAKSI